MPYILLFKVFVFCLLSFFSISSVAKPQIQHFRMLIQKTGLQFILNSQQPLKYKTQNLTNPRRFVLDIPNTQLNSPVERTHLANSVIKSFEIKKQKNGNLRAVFHLGESAKPVIQSKKAPGDSGYQLVLNFNSAKPKPSQTSYAKQSLPTPVYLPKPPPLTKKFAAIPPANIKKSAPTKKAASVKIVKRPAKPKTTSAKRNLAKAKTTQKSLPKKKTVAKSQAKPKVRPKVSKTIAAKKPRGRRSIVVVIDPGHGGKDPGAVSRTGHYEKTVVLAIAKRLAKSINQQKGFKAVLTRNGDYYVPLRTRLAIARKAKADLFVSVHADAFHKPSSHGVSIFALSQRGATSEAARWLAKRENISETLGDEKLGDKDYLLSSVLISLSQNHTISESLKVGKNMLKHIQPFAKLHHRNVEQASFVVLKSPDIPSLLVETGFLSNRHEEKRLRAGWYQQRLAKAMTLGIKQYFHQNPPPGTLIAAEQHKRLLSQK